MPQTKTDNSQARTHLARLSRSFCGGSAWRLVLAFPLTRCLSVALLLIFSAQQVTARPRTSRAIKHAAPFAAMESMQARIDQAEPQQPYWMQPSRAQTSVEPRQQFRTMPQHAGASANSQTRDLLLFLMAARRRSLAAPRWARQNAPRQRKAAQRTPRKRAKDKVQSKPTRGKQSHKSAARKSAAARKTAKASRSAPRVASSSNRKPHSTKVRSEAQLKPAPPRPRSTKTRPLASMYSDPFAGFTNPTGALPYPGSNRPDREPSAVSP